MDEQDFRQLPPRADLADLLGNFESLGVSCELGLIQRHCGVDKPGLFRFGYTPSEGLVQAIQADFEGAGEPNLLSLHEEPDTEWITTNQRYGFEFHTSHHSTRSSPQSVVEKMSAHFRYLGRKLSEEIQEGDKVFVYRAKDASNGGELAIELARSLAARGPAVLLWVMLAREASLAGQVRWENPGQLMFGYLDRFAPLRFAAGASYDCWLTVLQNAWALKNA